MRVTTKNLPRVFLPFVKIPLLATAVVVAVSFTLVGLPGFAVAAACAAPSANIGSASLSLSVPSAGNYRAWSRIIAPDATNNSYLLEVDGNTCYTVGDSAIGANTWTWVDYQNGATNSKLDVNLSAGTHTFKLIGREAAVKVDRLILASDTTCVPTGLGDNCTVNIDQDPPTVDLTAPANGATVSGAVAVQATASDPSGIAKVEFLVDGVIKSTVTASPYAYNWNTTTVANGAHSIMVKAYDKVGNINSDSASVTVANSDTQAPTAPTNLNATAPAHNQVNLSWTASADNVGVTGYWVQRDGVTLAKIGATTSYQDKTTVAATTYSYRVLAIDGAGNLSPASAAKSVTTPNVADTQAPTAPAGLNASAISTSQIDLTWTASTDNVGVAKYDVYRSTGGQATKVATVTTTSFGDTGLRANTSYNYYVVAQDAAGNLSPASTSVTAKTLQKSSKRGTITGKVTDERGQAFDGAHVIIWVNGSRHLYHTRSNGTYTITNLPTGFYSVKYTSHDDDYKAQTHTLRVGQGQTVTQNVSLELR